MRRYEGGVLVGEEDPRNTFENWLGDMGRGLEKIHASQDNETYDLFLNGRLSMIREVQIAWKMRGDQ